MVGNPAIKPAPSAFFRSVRREGAVADRSLPLIEISFLIELSFLNGRDKLKGYPVRSLVVY